MEKILKSKKFITGVCLALSVVSAGTIAYSMEKYDNKIAATAKKVNSLPKAPAKTSNYEDLVEKDIEELQNKLGVVESLEDTYKDLTTRKNSQIATANLEASLVEAKTDYNLAIEKYEDKRHIIKEDLETRKIGSDSAKFELEEAKKEFDKAYKQYRLDLTQKFEEINKGVQM